ncbi:MAG: DUF1501 domain-containing protein [Verrucomicrobiota bacterium]
MKNQQCLEHQLNRRQFLRQTACAALGYTGLVSTISHLSLVNSALAQTNLSNYRALVIVFLYGGNDSNNMLIPRLGHPSYAPYKSTRNVLGILDENDPDYQSSNPHSIPLVTTDGNYGVHHRLQPMADLFNDGDLAFVANVGSLTHPILTQDDFINGTVPQPEHLFSHTNQQMQWQSSIPDQAFATGWGGRIADLLYGAASDSDAVSMNISLDGINNLQVGNQVAQYSVDYQGAIPLVGFGQNYSGAWDGSNYTNNTSGKRLKAFEDIMNFSRSHLLEAGYNDVVRRARANEGLIGEAAAAADASGVDFDAIFGGDTGSLIGQLKMIAKLIAGRGSLGNSRQIFFCSAGGYDTHAAQRDAHDNLMEELGASLKAFSDAMIALGVNDDVLTISHSDFARTLSPNGTDASSTGTDHGWGGHQIVMGGGVNGSRIYGHFPNLILDTGRDVDQVRGRGRWIPTTSVDQYLASSARWLGIDNSALSTIFPNLSRFDDPFSGPANLGYVTL